MSRRARIFVLILCTVVVWGAAANGRWGGARPGIIDDRPQTVRDIEDRADRRWARNTAGRWVIQDSGACAIGGRETWRSYTDCMVERSNTRILYMLRRNCTGVDTIASVCKIEGK